MNIDNGKKSLHIYLCNQCDSAIGNSFYSVPTDVSKVTLLTDVEGLLMDASEKISFETGDRGCLYQALQCRECRNEVGRYYKAATKDLAVLTKKYALQISKIKSTTVLIPEGARCDRALETELKNKIDDLGIMAMEAMVERVQMQESIVTLGNLVGQLKEELQELKRQNRNYSDMSDL